MKAFLTENQLNKLIYESQGYADVFDDLIDYVYDITSSYMNDNFNMSINYNEAEKTLYDRYGTYYELGTLTLNEKILNSFEITFTNEIVIKLIVSNEVDGAFVQDSLKYEDDKIQTLTVLLNILTFFDGKDNVYETLHHELTHAYEFSQTILKKDHPYDTINNELNKTISAKNDSIDKNILSIIYLMSNREINANISSLYARLKSAKANRYNYKDILKSSNIYLTLTNLDKLEKIFEKNKLNIVNSIYEFSKKSEYSDIFPSSKNLTLDRFKKRLIRAVKDKKEKVIKRVDKVISAYLQKNA